MNNTNKTLAILIMVILALAMASFLAEDAYACRHSRHSARSIQWKHSHNVILRLNPTHIWFNYSDYSIYLNASGYPSILVDLDGNHTTAVTTKYGDYSWRWGTYTSVATVRILYDSGGPMGWWFTYSSSIILGERGVASPYRWIVRATVFGVGEHNLSLNPMIGEYFGITVQKTTAPSDNIVTIHRSDGTRILPITSRFWYSTDEGQSWRAVTP